MDSGLMKKIAHVFVILPKVWGKAAAGPKV